MQKTVDKRIVIRKVSGTAYEIPDSEIIDFKSTESVESFCGLFELSLHTENKETRDLVGPKDEIEIWVGYKDQGLNKIMAGYIDRVVIEKKESSAEIMYVFGRSYDSILTDHKVSGKIDYTKGYSEVIKQLLKYTPFSEGNIENTEGSGTVIFKDTPLIDIIRQVSEEATLVYKVDFDKKFHFCRNVSKTVAKPLDSKSIKSYRVVKQ